MTTNTQIKIYVPTYNRQNIKALELCKDNSIELILCIRSENSEINYDEFCKQYDNVSILKLGYGICDLAETRHRILQHSISNNEKYCIMFDDVISDVYSISKNELSISKCLQKCIDQLLTNSLSKYSICFALSTEDRTHCNSNKQTKYFLHSPIQAIIVNNDVAKKYDIDYKPMTYGPEDMVFFAETLQQGLITCNDADINIRTETCCKQKEGGTHSNFEIVELKNDKFCNDFIKTFKNMYGVYITKRFRSSIGSLCAFISFDYDYFYDVLVKDREKNKKIIDSQFKMEEL